MSGDVILFERKKGLGVKTCIELYDISGNLT